jgi:hypothetical protein
MECRISLFQIIPRGPEDQQSGQLRWSRTPGHHTRSPRTPPQPPIKKRLPLPKNVVLMSLIEATELAAENVRGQEPSLTASPMLDKTPSVLDVEEDEAEKIRTGTSLAISDCGTYAVAEKDGLGIYPSRPESAFRSGNDQSEEDVDTLVRFFHLSSHKLDLENGDQEQTSEDPEKEVPPVKLSLGDRVQIVSTEAGWAKLARGYGFVRADRHQLVKGTVSQLSLLIGSYSFSPGLILNQFFFRCYSWRIC